MQTMRKMMMLLLVLTCIIQATGQYKTVPQLIKELEDHPQQDAFRVDKLNDLSFNYFFLWDERRKFMEEALSVSQKINYSAGEACALASIGYYRAIDGKVQEGDSLLKRAESLVQKSGDPNLTGILLFRIGMKKLNSGDKEGMDDLFKAEKIFENSNNYDKQPTFTEESHKIFNKQLIVVIV